MFKGRTLLNAVFLMVLIYTLYSYLILPPVTATHFGSGGEPDGWATKEAYLRIMIGVLGSIYISFIISPKIIEKVPAKFVSLPNSGYWLSDENKPEAVRRFTGMIDVYGAATGLFMLAISMLTVRANKADPVMLEVFNNLFVSVAEQMGYALQNTARSVNIKERLDFSGAIFDAHGALIATAPHIPNQKRSRPVGR